MWVCGFPTRQIEVGLAVDLETIVVFRDKPTRAAKLHTIVELPIGEDKDLNTKFDEANQISNSLFDVLIPRKERARFMKARTR